MAEQVTDVDQVDSGLEEVHRPAPSDDVRGDVQAGRIAGVASAQRVNVSGEDLGDTPSGQSCLFGPCEQRLCVLADAVVGRATGEVVLQQPGCGVHQRDASGLGSFAVEGDQHRAGCADVGGVQVADLLDAGGGVVECGEQDRVAQPAPGGRVRFGQEGFDLVAGEVAHVGGRGLRLLDGEDSGGLIEELRPLDRDVSGERLDDGEALVARRRRVAAFGLQPVQEGENLRPVEVGKPQLLGWGRLHVAEPGEQQFDRVPVGGDGLGGQVSFAGEVVGEEPRQPPAGQIPAVGVGAAHFLAPFGASGVGMT